MAVTALLAIVGSAFVVTEARQQIRKIEDRGDDDELGALLTGTPAAGLARRGPLASSPQRPLRRPELFNLVVLVQLMQALLIASMVALLLVVLGLIVGSGVGAGCVTASATTATRPCRNRGHLRDTGQPSDAGFGLRERIDPYSGSTTMPRPRSNTNAYLGTCRSRTSVPPRRRDDRGHGGSIPTPPPRAPTRYPTNSCVTATPPTSSDGRSDATAATYCKGPATGPEPSGITPTCSALAASAVGSIGEDRSPEAPATPTRTASSSRQDAAGIFGFGTP